MNDEINVRSYTGAEFVVECVVAAGVTHVFGGHGGAIVPLIDEIVRHPALTWVYCRCEVNASQAAAAYAKLHKKIGCCIATSGPGATHLLSGLVDADQDRVPMICITGLKDTAKLHNSDFQDVDQAGIFRMARLGYSENIANADQLVALSRNAIIQAVASNRVSHLAIPVDIQKQHLKARSTSKTGGGNAVFMKVLQPADPVQIETLALALRTEIEFSRHVLIACGWRAYMLGEEIERLAEILRAPVLTCFDGKGTVDESRPLSFGVTGVYGNAGTPSSMSLLEDCDTVISICIGDQMKLVSSSKGIQIRRLIQIDERLMGGDALRFSPSAVFTCGFLRESLKRVIKALENGLYLSDDTRNRCLWKHSSHRINQRENSDKVIDAFRSSDIWETLKEDNFPKPAGTPSTFLSLVEGAGGIDESDTTSTEYCHPAVFFDVMHDHLRSDAIICADIGDNALWLASALTAKRGQRFLTSEHMGIMGYALNAGLAASVSSQGKNKQTLVITGDGGIQQSLNELATYKDHNCTNVLVVVIVNKRLGRVQNETWGATLHADGCEIGSPDYPLLFQAYGYPCGMKLSTCDKNIISSTVEKGWELAAKNGACIIEIHQNPLVHPIMYKICKQSTSLESHVNYESKVRNTNKKDLFPQIDTSHWAQHQNTIQKWLDSLSHVVKSKEFWIDSPDFVAVSHSKIVQDLFDSFNLKLELFLTHESRVTFDSQFRASFRNTFSSEVMESILTKGMSNTHPMCVQLIACPKNIAFPLHAHPNVELDIPIVGELWEHRALDVCLPCENLQRQNKVLDASNGKFFSQPSSEELSNIVQSLKQKAVFPDVGKKGIFVTRVACQGNVIYNATGSVHQSFAKDHGVLILALWSGVHAHFLNENFRQTTGISSLDLSI